MDFASGLTSRSLGSRVLFRSGLATSQVVNIRVAVRSSRVCVTIRSAGKPKSPAKQEKAARKAAAVVLKVINDATPYDIPVLTNKAHTLFPKTLLDALTERIRQFEWEAALKVFELVKGQKWYKADPDTYVDLLVMLGKCRQSEEAENLFRKMVDDGCPPTVRAYTSLLSAYTSCKRVSIASRLFEHMKTVPECQPDVYTYTVMIDACCVARDYNRARRLMAEMKQAGVEPNIVTYNSLMQAFGQAGKLSEMEQVFVHMLQIGKCRPDSWTWNIIIGNFGRRGLTQKMEEWFENLLAAGAQPDHITLNTLILAYGKEGSLVKLRFVLDYMDKYLYRIDADTYNIVLNCYGKAGLISHMEHAFKMMKRSGIKPTRVTFCSLISTYAKNRAWHMVEKIWRQVENSDVVPDTALYNCLIDAYRKAGNMDDMEAAFSKMKNARCTPDKITYTTLIEGYKEKGMAHKMRHMQLEMLAIKYS